MRVVLSWQRMGLVACRCYVMLWVPALDVRYVSTVSGPGADTGPYPLYLDRGTANQYVLYLIVSAVEADTDCIYRMIQSDTLYRTSRYKGRGNQTYDVRAHVLVC